MEQINMQLSIVVNMYNTASFLPRCMETLLDQDVSPESYEIILVDDGSTDNSLALAQEYVTKSTSDATMPAIRVEHHANKGLASARNTGLRAAKGKYLCFVDPDDYIEKQSLSSLLNQMDEENLDVLRFNYQKVDELGCLLPDKVVEQEFNYNPQLITGVEFMRDRLTTCCYVWAYIFRLELIVKNNVWFNEDCYFDDTPWLPRVLPLAKRMNTTNIRHLYYTQRNGSLVHTINVESIQKKVEGQLKLLEILRSQNVNNDVRCWYQSMESLIVISVLTTIALHLYDRRHDYLNCIKKHNLFPLSKYKSLANNRWKINLINLNPQLYMWMVHIRRKKKNKQ